MVIISPIPYYCHRILNNMETVTLNSLWIIIGIILTSGGVVFSVLNIFNALKDRIAKLEGKFYTLEKTFHNTSDQTYELVNTIKSIQENVSNILITQTEMRVVLSGVDGHNGLRGELRELKSELRELMNKM